MRKMRTVLASFAAFSLVLAACGGDDDDNAESDTGTAAETGGTLAPRPIRVATLPPPTRGSDTATAVGWQLRPPIGGDTVTAEQGTDLTFHMITHSDDGPFWSVVHRGMEAACEDLGVECVWLGSNNDPGVQVQLIEQAVSEGSDGIASALASPDQLVPPAAGRSGCRHPGDHAQLRLERLPVDRRPHARRPDRVHRRSGRGRAVQRPGCDPHPVRTSGRVERGARRALRRPRRHVQRHGGLAVRRSRRRPDRAAEPDRCGARCRSDDRRLYGHRSGHRHVGPQRRDWTPAQS